MSARRILDALETAHPRAPSASSLTQSLQGGWSFAA